MKTPLHWLKKLILLPVVLCFCTLQKCHAQDEALVHKTSAQRIIQLFWIYRGDAGNMSDSQYNRRVDHIEKLAIENSDRDLLLEARFLRLHRLYVDKRLNDRFIAAADSLNAVAIKEKKLWLELRVEHLLALFSFHKSKQYEIGFAHMQKLYNLMKPLSTDEFPLKKGFLYGISDVHYSFSDYRNAIFYFNEGFGLKSPFNDEMGNMISLNTVGLCYRELGQLDSSDYYFKLSYQMAIANKSRVWEGIISGNLGYNHYARKEYDQAIPLLQKDVDIAIETMDWGLASGSLMPLAAISLERHDIAKAEQQIKEARDYVYRSGQYKRLPVLYPLMSKLYAAQGRPGEAAIFLDSALYVKDSVARTFNALQVVRARQYVELEQQKAETAIIAGQKRFEVLKRNILIGIVILGMLIAVYLLRQQQKKQKQEREKWLKAEEELKNATRQLSEFTRYISEKNNLIENLQQQLGDKEGDALQKLQISTILTDEEWEYFRQLFEKVHGGYLQRVKEKLPGLTPAETRFMALSKLKFSNKEMAATLGISPQAIRVTWHRLRKKLGLPEESSITDLVDSL